jgi:cell division protein FtsQ
MNPVDLMNRIARLCLGLALLLFVGAGAIWLLQRPLFDIRRIEVRFDAQSDRHVGAAEVRAAMRGRLKGNFFTMSLVDAQRTFETIPWVASASVRRVWPDRLRVTLREHRPLGIWNGGMVVSDEGRLFSAPPSVAARGGPLVAFEGPEQSAADAVMRYREFSAVLAPLGLSVAAVQVSDRGSWSLRTDAAQRVQLGRDDPVGAVAQRLALVVQHYPAVEARLGAAPARIDARYPNGFAAAAAGDKKR